MFQWRIRRISLCKVETLSSFMGPGGTRLLNIVVHSEVEKINFYGNNKHINHYSSRKRQQQKYSLTFLISGYNVCSGRNITNRKARVIFDSWGELWSSISHTASSDRRGGTCLHSIYYLQSSFHLSLQVFFPLISIRFHDVRCRHLDTCRYLPNGLVIHSSRR